MPVNKNNRIFYACQAVAIEPLKTDTNGNLVPSSSNNTLAPQSGSTQILHGVQSVGINTTFNLEQVFELGQIHIYENMEGVPDIEVTLEKVLDGYPLMYHVASTAVREDTSLPSDGAKMQLVARSSQRCNVILGIFPDTVAHIGDTNDPAIEVLMSGMYISSIGYTIPVDGNSTESLTLVGNHKQWNSTATKLTAALARQLGSGIGGLYSDNPQADQRKLNSQFTGGVQRRENVSMSKSIFPQSINGVQQNTSPGNAYDTSTKKPRIHVQNVNISCDLNRESVQELGRKAPYTRYANFPVEVTCEIEAITSSGDFVQALEGGRTSGPGYTKGEQNYGNNTANEAIRICLHDGTVIDLGNKNRLSSVNYGGGDAGGGNATVTYSYSTFNALNVLHPADPASIQATAVGGFQYNQDGL